MKKGGQQAAGGLNSTIGGNYASTGGAAAAMSETQGGVKFELVGMPDCMDENLAASKE